MIETQEHHEARLENEKELLYIYESILCKEDTYNKTYIKKRVEELKQSLNNSLEKTKSAKLTDEKEFKNSPDTNHSQNDSVDKHGRNTQLRSSSVPRNSEISFDTGQKKKEDKTLSNLTSGDTKYKQVKPTKERRGSFNMDNHSAQSKKYISQDNWTKLDNTIEPKEKHLCKCGHKKQTHLILENKERGSCIDCLCKKYEEAK